VASALARYELKAERLGTRKGLNEDTYVTVKMDCKMALFKEGEYLRIEMRSIRL